MSRCFETLAVLALASVVAAAASGAGPSTQAKFGFGQPATAVEIAGWDMDVRPDGQGLPPGRGSVAQGQDIYDAKCASCHGTFGESTDYLPLAGGIGTLGTSQPMRTTGSKLNYATTLFDYIRRAMPFPNPKSLTDDEVYALTAYVLNLNDILPADAVLDRESLPKVRMPNREGFTTDHGFLTKHGRPDTHNVACMRDCVRSVKLSSEMPDYARDSHGNLAEQTRAVGPVEGTRTAARSAKPSAAEVERPRASVVAQDAGCMSCHSVSAKIVGPAFRDVAARYAGEAGAAARLVAKIHSGGSGAWGSVPMPAQSISGEQGKLVVDWILSGQY